MATAFKITSLEGYDRIVVTDDPPSIKYHIQPGETCIEFPQEFTIPLQHNVIAKLLDVNTSIPD